MYLWSILPTSSFRADLHLCLFVLLFPQTGTLTEEGLDMWGVMEAGQTGFSELVADPRLLASGPMISALACSHTVALLGGQPLGDPLELKMIESTGWVRR